MSDVKIQQDVLEGIIAHAKKEAPIEACGYLASKDGVINKHYPLRNVDESEEHFSFDPKEQFSVVSDAREKGLSVSAVYHSHPVTPARPSNEDIRLAFDPKIHYVIVSLASEEATVNAYKITKAKEEMPSVPEGNAYDIQNDLMVVQLEEDKKYLIEKEAVISV